SLFKKPETIQYPAQTRFVPEGLKGHVVIEINDCILCGICMKRCPTGAISVDKPAATWSIDRFRCVQCGSCVRECPKNCLSMDPAYAPPATKKSIDVVSKDTATDGINAAKDSEPA
ncbi:MAG: 4Fe-4S dicluster domain-containing protein, partial [Raoultibacter sp.]